MTVPAFVAKSPAPVGGSLTYTPVAPGNDIVIAVVGFNNNPALPSITNTGGEPVLADFAFASNIGVYRVHGVLAGSHTFTPNWSPAPAVYSMAALELSGVYGLDPALVPAVVSGSVATAATNAFSPPANGDFLLSAFTVNHYLSSIGSWTNGFTQLYQAVAGPSYAWGYLANAGGGAPISAGVTINPANAWNALMVAYAGAPPPSATSLSPRRFFLPPGPGRFSGRGASGLGIGPFTTFLVKDVHRLVPRTQTPTMPRTAGRAKSTGHAALTTSIRPQSGGSARNAVRSSLTTQSPLASASTSVCASRSTIAAPTHFASSSQDISNSVSQLATQIRFVSAVTSRSSGRSAPNTMVTLVSSSRAKAAARSQLGTEIAIVSKARAVNLTHAVAMTSIALRASGHSVSRASASQLKRVLFTSAGRSVSVGKASLLTAKPIFSHSGAVNAVRGQETGRPSFSSYSSARSAGGAHMTTAVMLEMDPHPGAVNTGSLLQVIAVRFGYSIIEVELESGVPPLPGEPVSIFAGSVCFVTAKWFDADGNPYVPLAVNYSIQDVTSGTQIAGPVALPASDVNLVTVTSAQNAMVNDTREAELHQVLFEITDQLGETFYRYGAYRIVRLPGND